MRYTIALLLTSACGTLTDPLATDTATHQADAVTGVPVDYNQLLAVRDAVEAATHKNVPRNAQYHFSASGDYSVTCDEAGCRAEVGLVDIASGELTTCLYTTGLAHTMIHMIYGPGEDDTRLWKYPTGIVWDIRAQLAPSCP